MSAQGIVWAPGPERITAKVALLGARFAAEVTMAAQLTALEGERYAKQRAPWANITGNARAGLRGTSSVQGMSGEIRLEHGVDYGIWLELAHGRQWGILPHALDHAASFLDGRLDGMLARAARGGI